jgi:hypothetical protein
MDHDDLITWEDCRERAAHCASAAERTTNEQVRQLLQSMQKMWLKLATEIERLETARRLVFQQSQPEQRATSDPDRSGTAPVIETRSTEVAPVV